MKNVDSKHFILVLFAFIGILSSFSAKAVTCIPDSVTYGTYLGGGGDDYGFSTTRDKFGNTYFTGYTSSPSGIATTGAYQTNFGGNTDAFLAKYDCSGKLVWATYYGGNGEEKGTCVRIDDSGYVYLTGVTGSTTGLATSGAYQTSNKGVYDAFLAKFNSNGALIWGTFFGGPGTDIAWGLVIDTGGNVYLDGETLSSTNIATSGAYQTNFGGGYSRGDAFLVKFNGKGSRLWATYFGGSGDEFSSGMAIDASNNLYITGSTTSTSGIATTGAYQTSYAGGSWDAYLVKFSSSGSRLWSTYYGGNSYDYAEVVAADFSGGIYITGVTSSTSGIASAGGYQTSYGGGAYDAYLAKFDSTGSRVWSTYYGGNGDDRSYGIATDAFNNVYFGGATSSTSGIATAGSFQTANGGGYDAFSAKFSSSGWRQYATYFGGANTEYSFCMSADALGSIYMAGFTGSTSGIATAGANQTSFGGGNYDAFFVKIASSHHIDGGISALSPSSNKCAPAGVQPLKITFNNYGTDTLVSDSIFWRLNGVLIANIEWTGSLAPGTSTTVNFGNYNFTAGIDTIVAWSANPNGTASLAPRNDTIKSIIIFNSSFTTSAGANTFICHGSSDSIGEAAVSGHSYSWVSRPAGFASTVSKLSVTPLVTTTYYLTEKVTLSGCSQSDSVVVTVNALPSAIAGSGSIICNGKTASIGAAPVSGNTYSWSSYPAGFSDSISNPVVSPVVTTTYYVSGSNVCGNKTDSVVIMVIPAPTATTGSNAAICIGSGIYIGDTAVSGNTYSWTSNPSGFNSTLSGQSVSPTVTTTYFLTEKTTLSGCSKSDSVVIAVNPLPAANAGSKNSICHGNAASIGGSAVAGNTYSWTTKPTGFTDTTAGPSVSPTITTTYYLTERITATGCTNSDSVIIKVDTACKGFVTMEMDTSINTFDTLKVNVYVNNTTNLYSLYCRLNISPDIFKLVSSAPGHLLGNSIIYTPAVPNNGYIDFGITKQGAQSGSNGSGLFYSFTFVVIDTFPLVDIKSVFSLDSIIAYNNHGSNILIMDSAGKTVDVHGQAIVWPGDLNNDKVVDVSDILPIGYFYNKTGPKRNSASLTWETQKAPLWGDDKTHPNSTGWEVFADANGDGIIGLADEAAIGLNMSQTHLKQSPVYVKPNMSQDNSSSDPTLTAVFPDTLISESALPAIISIPVNVGTSSIPLSNLMGMSFKLSFNPKYVNTSSISLDFTNSIFGVQGTDYIEIVDSNFASGELSIGMTRFNTTPLNTYGNVVNFKFTVPSGAPAGYFTLFADVMKANDNNGNKETINSSQDSVHIAGVTTYIAPVSGKSLGLSVYPNPFSSALNISYILPQSQNVSLSITDITGKEITSMYIGNQSQGRYTYTIDAEKYNLTAGVYFLHMVAGAEVIDQKIIRIK